MPEPSTKNRRAFAEGSTSVRPGMKVRVRQLRHVDGKVRPVWSQDLVRVMAVAEGYAMVRFRGAMPFAAMLKDIEP